MWAALTAPDGKRVYLNEDHIARIRATVAGENDGASCAIDTLAGVQYVKESLDETLRLIGYVGRTTT